MMKVYLKPGREKPLLRKHPWVFSGSVEKVTGDPQPGDTVGIYTSKGDFLATGAYSPHSQIRVRVWTWDQQESVDSHFFRNRIQRALSLREALNVTRRSEVYRLVNAESDGLSGFIVDRYGEVCVLQCLTAGAECWREVFAKQLLEATGVVSIFERSDVDVRKLEGLEYRTGLLTGKEPPSPIKVTINSLDFWIDIHRGQKTGFYLDQRENHYMVRSLAKGREVLDCFSYSGGFGINALYGGASRVTFVESSEEALALGRENVRLNGLSERCTEWVQGDVFEVLRSFRDSGRSFDLIILDPPKFAVTAAQKHRAARGYKDINMLALKLLKPSGLLVTFSCSGGVDVEFFWKIIAGAALDAGLEVQVLYRLTQPSDHPLALNFPEGEYLKGFVCRRVD
ncbi:MAG: class I SAM-dependent methyltransferase [Chloroflexota bacterium]